MIHTDVTIIGLGNMLMQDEGIGVFIANLLDHKFIFSPPVTIIDGGTIGIELLPYFEESRKVLLIDAVDFRIQPGYLTTLRDEEILTMLTSKISLHHLGLSDVLSMIRILDIKPESIFLVGIQPVSVELSSNISAEMKDKINIIIKEVVSIVEGWDIAVRENIPHPQYMPDK